jgi:AcrR family transcriptional regulator
MLVALRAEHRHIAAVMALLSQQLNAIERGDLVDTHVLYEIIFHKCELTEANQAIVDRHRRNYLEIAERIRRLLENARQQGQLPADFDAALATRQLQVQVTGLLYLWLLWDNPERMVAEATCLVDAYLDSLPLCYRSAPSSGQARSTG